MGAGSDYDVSLAKLAATRPRVARMLQKAEQLRASRLHAYLPGMRLAGLEQLLNYLEAMRDVYQGNDELARIAFLITRAVADFETALEATLSGYQGVAADAMRDVMEIQYLLLDFTANPDHLVLWLECDRRTRIRQFQPEVLRKRLAKAGLPPFSDKEWEPLDYRAHSEAWHVTPQASLISARGIEAYPEESMLSDSGFIEIFEHGYWLLRAVEMLRIARGLEPTRSEPLVPLDDFYDARARTGEMQVMIIAMIEGPAVLRKKLGREPTISEVLKHMAEAVSTKSLRRPAPHDV